MSETVKKESLTVYEEIIEANNVKFFIPTGAYRIVIGIVWGISSQFTKEPKNGVSLFHHRDFAGPPAQYMDLMRTVDESQNDHGVCSILPF